jgi:hypothetical protein
MDSHKHIPDATLVRNTADAHYSDIVEIAALSSARAAS